MDQSYLSIRLKSCHFSDLQYFPYLSIRALFYSNPSSTCNMLGCPCPWINTYLLFLAKLTNNFYDLLVIIFSYKSYYVSDSVGRVLFENFILYRAHFLTHFHQPLSNCRFTSLWCRQCPLRQCWANGVIYTSTFQPFQKRLSKNVFLNQRRHLNVNLLTFPKQKNILLDATHSFK